MRKIKRYATSLTVTMALALGIGLAGVPVEAHAASQVPHKAHVKLHKYTWQDVKKYGKDYVLVDIYGRTLTIEPGRYKKLCKTNKKCLAYTTLDVKMAALLKRELKKCPKGAQKKACWKKTNKRVKARF